MDDTDRSTGALLSRWVPATMFMRRGTLSRRGDQLTFRLRNQPYVQDPYLAAPLNEIHSVTVTPSGITLWHGDKRYRFTFVIGPDAGPVVPGYPSHVQGDIDASMVAALKNYDVASDWGDNLKDVVGVPPAGLHVPTPWTLGKWLIFVGIVTVVAPMVFAVVLYLVAG